MATVTDFTFTAAPLKNRVVAFVTDFVAAAQKRKMYRTTVAELSALSSHELNDLGISRSDIRRIAMETSNLV